MHPNQLATRKEHPMPQRSNEYQRLVTLIYTSMTTDGARVSESAMVQEYGGGAMREIDILIEHRIAGVDVRIAIECRDSKNVQTIQWIDALIGKYQNLPIDRVIAVSPTGFRPKAKMKAEANRIELVTTAQAEAKDWSAVFSGQWKQLSHSFTLMRITTLNAAGEVVTETNVDAQGDNPKHLDDFSKDVFGALRANFMEHHSAKVGAALTDKIGEKWQYYIDNPTPRWAEFEVQVPPGTNVYNATTVKEVTKIAFGVGTIFEVTRQVPKHVVMDNRAAATFIAPKENASFRIVIDDQKNVLHVEAAELHKQIKPRRT